ncbi:MAG: Lipolytic protein family [Haloplasmataceae bacterium]|nr:Lipolytic protein family [Haloplasmataceae bacterium]
MTTDNILFLGDSITANFKLLDKVEHAINLGIGGDKTTEILNRINTVYQYNPKKLFLLIGINDYLVNKGIWSHPEVINIISNYEVILTQLTHNLPDTKFYSLSIFPLGENSLFSNDLLGEYNEGIDNLNREIEQISYKYNFEYIDLNQYFKDDQGNLKNIYSLDGIHLTLAGYLLFLELIDKII